MKNQKALYLQTTTLFHSAAQELLFDSFQDLPETFPIALNPSPSILALLQGRLPIFAKDRNGHML
jgi:hypothetical protein